MSRVTMRLGSDFHRLPASLMKIKLLRFVANGLRSFINVSRDFYLARMILLAERGPSPQGNAHPPTEGV